MRAVGTRSRAIRHRTSNKRLENKTTAASRILEFLSSWFMKARPFPNEYCSPNLNEASP